MGFTGTGASDNQKRPIAVLYRLLLFFIQLWHNINIKNKLAKLTKALLQTTVIPVVFVILASVYNLILLRGDYQSEHGTASLIDSASASVEYLVIEDEEAILDLPIAETDEDFIGFVVVDSASLLNSSSPLSTIIPTREGLIRYKVQTGDTLSKIAASFGISVNTILSANQNLRSNLIRPGQELLVLPVSGVLHQVQEDESPESIAELYGVDVNQILKFNRDLKAPTLIVPGAKPVRITTASAASKLPDLSGYFVLPTTGWNWGRIHPNNAVDIANACGTPVYAAAEGLVISEKSYGWNDGYGHMIDLEHPNGVVTRYAHNDRHTVSLGDYVAQGDLIAYIGNTGNVHGPTGCHLHFEVRGARNPFAK